MALLSGGILGSLTRAGRARADQPRTDAQLTSDLLAVELLAVAVYRRVLDRGILSARAQRASRRVLAQERAHAAALRSELERLKQPSPVGPQSDSDIDDRLSARHVSRSVSDLHTEHECLDLLLAVEGMAEGAYYTAMSKLSHPRLLTLSAQILANEAQHEAVLGQLRRGKDFSVAAPYAFVQGIH